MKYIIERCEDEQAAILQSEKDFAKVWGQPKPERRPSYFYRHKKTGAEFCFIVGAFALPGFELPGFGVIIGLDRHKHPTHKRRIIRVLEEFEARSLRGVIEGLLDFKRRYGVLPIQNHLSYSDLDPLSYNRFANAVQKIGGNIHPLPGPYSQESNSFIEHLITFNNFKRIVDRGNCTRLRNHMACGPKNQKEALRFKPEDNPAIVSIAYAVSALMIYKPWTWGFNQSFIDEY